ncbi:MAG TPA: RNA polymerase sigma factor RpoH [Alphaproteobacteria bacterium]|nr:RNA polymerase sigma factor RpoH [Alphaproteobacteria bacterium]HIK87330.1 RNA polymerase sigma factor RpoH [Alphaproteobacteria bacterium]
MSNITLPSISADGSLRRYMAEIGQFPILRKDEEFTLAKNWLEHEDIDAAHTLVTSHLRLVAKIAMGYRGYGLPISDLISEGNIGLMKAVKRFDPDKGFRLATYALLWIKASIQEYILHSWSLVKIGTTSAQKKLFFNLRRIKNELKVFEEKELSPEIIKKISQKLVVDEQEVINMNQRIGGDYSLNASRTIDANKGDWQEVLVDDKSIDQETYVSEKQELDKRKSMLGNALSLLSERERIIFSYRRLTDEPKTLEELSKEFNISRERVRQIEVKAFDKVQIAVKSISKSQSNLAIENNKTN